MTAELSRTSALASRHKALGSELEDWNGMGTAWSYSTNPEDEHDAVRTRVGLFDMSPLKKVHVRGKDADLVIDEMITRDLNRITPGKSTYGAILTEAGTIADDAIVAKVSDTEWLFCHGSGNSMELLEASCSGLNVDLEFNDALHNIAVQGPGSCDLLNSHTPFDLENLAYFNHLETEVFGHTCRVSRTGYSGERGYEIFCDASVVGDIWDNLIGQGEQLGVMPCSFTALDKVRIEAALLFYGYDMTDEHFPTEVGLDFTVSATDNDFRGKKATIAARGQERFVAAGIVANTDSALVGGEQLQLRDNKVGIVNSPCWSHRLNKSLALVHIEPDFANEGTELQVVGDEPICTAVISKLPFYDPDKLNVRS